LVLPRRCEWAACKFVIAALRCVIAGLRFVIAALRFVIAALRFVIAGLTRNPVAVRHWIPDVETPDLIRGRDDKLPFRDDKRRVWDDKGTVEIFVSLSV
jgi:hypothetical protein